LRVPLVTYIAAGDAERVGLTRALITRNAWFGSRWPCWWGVPVGAGLRERSGGATET